MRMYVLKIAMMNEQLNYFWTHYLKRTRQTNSTFVTAYISVYIFV
jgi:hypothetical protein